MLEETPEHVVDPHVREEVDDMIGFLEAELERLHQASQPPPQKIPTWFEGHPAKVFLQFVARAAYTYDQQTQRHPIEFANIVDSIHQQSRVGIDLPRQVSESFEAMHTHLRDKLARFVLTEEEPSGDPPH